VGHLVCSSLVIIARSLVYTAGLCVEQAYQVLCCILTILRLLEFCSRPHKDFYIFIGMGRRDGKVRWRRIIMAGVFLKEASEDIK
jgi:hypothetical protein